MKLGIVGLSGRIGTVQVPDDRIDRLRELYQPKKTIHAQVEYYLPGTAGGVQDAKKDQSIWTQARDCHALIHVIRNFKAFG